MLALTVAIWGEPDHICSMRIAVGTVIAGRPRTKPYGPERSGIRLPPWVFDGEALIWPRMKYLRFWESVTSQSPHPFPREAMLLAASPQRA